MFKYLCSIFMIFSLLFASAARSDSINGQSGFNDRETSMNAADQKLAEKINSKIGPGWFFKGYDKVAVKVSNGNVELTGFVKSWDEKDTVETEVRKINGVRSLNSQVRVEAPNSEI